jgi:hypothetical protein
MIRVLTSGSESGTVHGDGFPEAQVDLVNAESCLSTALNVLEHRSAVRGTQRHQLGRAAASNGPLIGSSPTMISQR